MSSQLDSALDGTPTDSTSGLRSRKVVREATEQVQSGASNSTSTSATASTSGEPQSRSGSIGAAALARALILLQLMSRLLTFGLNQALVRLAHPSVFGTVSIQFDLLFSSILFLSREGVRNALLRGDWGRDGDGGGKGVESKEGDKDTNPIPDANPLSAEERALAALPLRLGLGIAVLLVWTYLLAAPATTTAQPHFHLALGLYVLSALLEISVEPLYIRTLRSTPPRIKVRVQAEGGREIVRAVVVLLLLVGDKQGAHALLCFAFGQLAGSAWLSGRYIYEYGGVGEMVAPSQGYKYDPKAYALAKMNTQQSLVKHILTESDRLAVSYISPLGDQGGYAIAMNYGSLVARIIFQPVEETLLVHWSRSLQSASTIPLLTLAVRMAVHLAILLPVFAPPLLPIVLPVLLPRAYSAETSAAQTLQTYLVRYLPVMALNGILEAFHAASATPAQVARQAGVMFASSGAFAGCLWLLTRGLKGSAFAPSVTTEQALIYASWVAMLVRIAYAAAHAWKWTSRKGNSHSPSQTPSGAGLTLKDILPRWNVQLAIAVAGSATWQAAARLGNGGAKDQMAVLGIGACAGLSVLATIFVAERNNVQSVGRMLARESRD